MSLLAVKTWMEWTDDIPYRSWSYIRLYMTIEHQVSNCVKRAYHSLRNLRSIRKYLTKKALYMHSSLPGLTAAMNALLYGLPKGQLQKWQRVQNAAARLVTNTRKYAHNYYHTSLEKSPLASCRTAFDIQNSSDHLSGIKVLITAIHQLTH